MNEIEVRNKFKNEVRLFLDALTVETDLADGYEQLANIVSSYKGSIDKRLAIDVLCELGIEMEMTDTQDEIVTEISMQLENQSRFTIDL
jgi:hypothetical protein